MATMENYARNDNPRLHTEFDLGKTSENGKNPGNESSDKSERTQQNPRWIFRNFEISRYFEKISKFKIFFQILTDPEASLTVSQFS